MTGSLQGHVRISNKVYPAGLLKKQEHRGLVFYISIIKRISIKNYFCLYTSFCPQLAQKFPSPVLVPQLGQNFGFSALLAAG